MKGTPVFHIRQLQNKCPVIAGILLIALSRHSMGADVVLERFQFEQIRMGIPVNITLYAPSDSVANKAADAAYARFKEIDRLLSDYDPDSELMRLCAAPAKTPFPVSRETAYVLDYSLQLSRKTDGAFDVSVGHLTRLWRVARRRKRLPEQGKLDEALKLTGYQHIHVDLEKQTVCLDLDGMQLDVGAIAKGFAADEALKAMQQHGVSRVLIDAGGDLVLGDPPPGRESWKVAIEPLRIGKKSESPVFLALSNCSVATSGDAYQHVEIEGVRYSHIVNPSTGVGLTTPSSVTVIAPTGILADALASAVSVLGPEPGLALVGAYRDSETFVVSTRDPSGEAQAETHATNGFARFVAP
ncbi:MAG: FAD:protein FMN transferase [Planctomycetaceae bacterium]|nr:FAD:protein FMN transferase [Planctomycetaceae bacterium]